MLGSWSEICTLCLSNQNLQSTSRFLWYFKSILKSENIVIFYIHFAFLVFRIKMIHPYNVFLAENL